MVLVSASNAVNLTDGLDGLAIGSVLIASAAYTALAYVAGHFVFSEYLRITFLKNAGEITVFGGAMVGASIGFLWYNAYPAEVFMGDTGSLSLGGSIGTIAVLIKQEFLLIFVGGLFVLEALSVIIQVSYYKITKKRVFLMAPLHHHFELKRMERTEGNHSFLDPCIFIYVTESHNIETAMIEGKNILIAGFARTGQAVARFLMNRNCKISVSESRDASEFGNYSNDFPGVEFEFGGHRSATFLKADLIVLSPGIPDTIEPIVEAKKKGIRVISEIELAYHFLKGTLIGITGTNGKSTTTELTGAIFVPAENEQWFAET